MQRDIVRIGGSWSEFAGYFVTSLKSQDLKLLLELDSSSYGSYWLVPYLLLLFASFL